MDAIRWDGDGLRLLDQRKLPLETQWIQCRSWQDVALAIQQMVVRGAPAIAISAAYGMALAVKKGDDRRQAAEGLLAARPTAVNLSWALERLADVPEAHLEQEAIRIHDEDRAICMGMGQHGRNLLSGGVVTICNTGSLATGGYGTALGMVRSAHNSGREIHLYVLETRPYLQGARLTAAECLHDGIPFTLITDSMAGALMASKAINAVVVGCDRVASNGDTANKIGTYTLAVLARHHDIPFYVAMPMSTLDHRAQSGEDITIEQRPGSELIHVGLQQIAPTDTPVWNPAFDLTPADLITGWVTENGFWYPQGRAPLDDADRNR